MSLKSRICAVLAGESGEQLKQLLVDTVYSREQILLTDAGYEVVGLDAPPYIETNAPEHIRMQKHNEALDQAMSLYLEAWESVGRQEIPDGKKKSAKKLLDACMDVFKRSYYSEEQIAHASGKGN